jgi:hypothetical protein
MLVNKTKGAFKMMNKITLSIITALGLIGLLFSNGAQAQEAPDATEIMKRSHMAYYYAADDGLTEVDMSIVDSRGRERVRKFTMFRLDETDGGDQKYYTYFHEPSDVRRMTFMVHKSADGQDKRWLYVPAVDLIKPISADDQNSSFVGSDFTYEDVSGRLWTLDTHKLLREDKLNDESVWVIESTPKNEDYEGFARKVSLISQDSYLPLREEYYDDDDELERVFTAENIETADEIKTTTQRKMENVQKERYTIVTFESIDYDVGISDDVFTQRFLKNPPREYIK